MKKISFSSVLVLLSVAVFAFGCQTAATTAANADAAVADSNANAVVGTPAAEPTDDAPRISLADAKADYDAKSAIFVDTRSESGYKAEHIKGAVNISQADLAAKLSSLPKDKKIIAYCS